MEKMKTLYTSPPKIYSSSDEANDEKFIPTFDKKIVSNLEQNGANPSCLIMISYIPSLTKIFRYERGDGTNALLDPTSPEFFRLKSSIEGMVIFC